MDHRHITLLDLLMTHQPPWELAWGTNSAITGLDLLLALAIMTLFLPLALLALVFLPLALAQALAVVLLLLPLLLLFALWPLNQSLCLPPPLLPLSLSHQQRQPVLRTRM